MRLGADIRITIMSAEKLLILDRIFQNKQKSLGRSKDNLGAVGNGPSISVSIISPAPAGNRLCRRCLNGYSKQGGTMNKLDREK